jgi:drug/metabolite transporter superfamily protein YnfA
MYNNLSESSLLLVYEKLVAAICVWLWFREDMMQILGATEVFLFLYGIVPTLQPTYFHRIYATYGDDLSV